MNAGIARWIGLLVLPAMLAGCARYVPRPIHPQAAAAHLAARRFDDPGLLRFLRAMGRSSPRWTVGTLTLVALYERPDLPIATAQYEIARGGTISAAAIPNPVLDLSPTYDTAAGLPSPVKVGPIVSFLVGSFGARSANVAAARADVAAARTAISTTAWRERARVRDALLSLWRARRRARLAQAARRVDAEIGRVLEQRYAAGMISAPVLNEARLSAENAGFAATEARRQEALARSRLAAALGMPERALNGIRLDFAVFAHVRTPTDFAALGHAALVRRPSVQAALARYRAAQDRLRAAVDAQYPAFRIGPGYHYDQGANKFILALSLPLPVFNQNQGPIAIARARRRLAAAKFDAAQQRVLAQIETARADWRSSTATRLSAAKAARTADAEETGARQAFGAGATGRLRLLNARAVVVQAEENALVARGQELAALGRLEDALHHRFFRSGS